jgi:hypothetical protein
MLVLTIHGLSAVELLFDLPQVQIFCSTLPLAFGVSRAQLSREAL